MTGKRIYTPKIIADPIYGVFDIRPVLAMIETREFQALADKRQLGMSYLIFPSATHTRMAHSLGAYHATRELADRWVAFGFINKEEADALAAYALYHDIGHPAFSHVTEDLCTADNDELGLRIVKTLRPVIEKCGVNYALIESLASHTNPLYLGVHDKNLGMEKLDYLERDGLSTILSRPSGVDYLRKHIYFIDKQIMIDEKVVDNAIEVQNFYLKMYKNVYLRKGSVISQRMVQKMVHHSMLEKEIAPDDLPKLTDSELIGIMRTSKNAVVQKIYALLRERTMFREAIVIRHQDFMTGRNPDKPIAAFGFGEKEIEQLIASPALQNKNQDSLEALEKIIADYAGIPHDEVLAVPVFNSWRFKPRDITIYREGGHTASLKERFPAHFKNMEETGKSYFAFRICTLEEHRKKLSEPACAKAIIGIIQKFTLH